jgi:hypothetical protein
MATDNSALGAALPRGWWPLRPIDTPPTAPGDQWEEEAATIQLLHAYAPDRLPGLFKLVLGRLRRELPGYADQALATGQRPRPIPGNVCGVAVYPIADQ